MKSNKRLFIEKHFSGTILWADREEEIEKELLEAIEKDDYNENRDKKFEDWEYMLKNAVYLSLLGYKESSGYSIPCKTRERIENAVLKTFKKNMSRSNFNPPKP